MIAWAEAGAMSLHFTILMTCPPFPPLRAHFAVSKCRSIWLHYGGNGKPQGVTNAEAVVLGSSDRSMCGLCLWRVKTSKRRLAAE